MVGGSDAAPVRFRTRKNFALLAILARQVGAPVARERVIGLLWGEKDEEGARANLRQCLALLRKDLAAFPEFRISTPNDGLCLEASVDQVDVTQFEALSHSENLADQIAALGVYKGPFLDGYFLNEASFEDWLRDQRIILHGRAVDIAERLFNRAKEGQDSAEVVGSAQRLLALEPHREDAHRALIHTYAQLGRRGQALAQYQTCRDMLARDLDIKPDAKTERLVASVRNETIEPPADPKETLIKTEVIEGDEPAASSGRASTKPGPTLSARSTALLIPRKLVASAVVVFALLVGGLVWWQPWAPDVAPLRSERLALPLPDKPSIAVLAFDNLTEDPGQDYLSEAISESIITELSRFPELFVISRNSSFSYKDKPIKIQQVAEELGVRYVLEGSLQRSGDRIRVSAQLIDALKGNHLWAERYDRQTEDLFTIQDDVTSSIVATVQGKVLNAERKISSDKPEANLTALEYVMKGDKIWLEWNHEAMDKARALYEKALDEDPTLVRGYLGLVGVYIAGHRNGWTDLGRDKALELAFENARKAVELAPYDYSTHFRLGAVYTEAGDQDRALAEYDRALELNPNAAGVLAKSADSYYYQGRFEEAVERLHLAMRLNPHYPDWWNWNLADCYYFLGDYETAHTTLLKQNPFPNLARRLLAAIYVRMGKMDEARASIAEFLKNEPGYTMEDLRLNFDGKFTDPALLKQALDDVRAAGLPER